MRVHRIVAGLAFAALAVTAPGASAADTSPPRVAFTTPNRAVVVSPVDAVRGVATDDVAGVVRVRVTFCGNGTLYAGGGWSCGGLVTTVIESVDASLSCVNARRSCTWAATPPVQPDNYLVFATATDGAGRTGSAPDPILVTVV